MATKSGKQDPNTQALQKNREAQAELAKRIWELAVRADPTIEEHGNNLVAEERQLLAVSGPLA